MLNEPRIIRHSQARHRHNYVRRLRRRVIAGFLCAGGALVVSLLALLTVRGQGVDTIVMEAVSQRLGIMRSWHSMTTGFVSLLNIGLASLLVVLIAGARRRWSLASRAVAIIAVSNVLIQFLKWVVVRPDLGLTNVFPNSLPSGHVAVAASLAVAMVVVAPDYLRSMAVWLGWMWSALVGLLVMAQSWHRLSDVVVSFLVVGCVALLLAPLESQARHFPVGQMVMSALVWTVLLLAVVDLLVGVVGVDMVEVAQFSPQGYGFREFLAAHPRRELLAMFGGVCGVLGVSGLVIREVDRLRWSDRLPVAGD